VLRVSLWTIKATVSYGPGRRMPCPQTNGERELVGKEMPYHPTMGREKKNARTTKQWGERKNAMPPNKWGERDSVGEKKITGNSNGTK